MIAPGALLARVDDIADPGALVIRIDENDLWGAVLLTRTGEAIAAFHNRCAHAAYPLQRANGGVALHEGRYLVCAAHGASYALDTGACAGGPCNGEALKRIAIEVRDGSIYAA